MHLGHSGIVVYIFLILLKLSFLELGHFGNTLYNSKSTCKNFLSWGDLAEIAF